MSEAKITHDNATRSKGGLVLVWTDIPANLNGEFNDWYNREHAADRVLGVPGYISGRRFVALAEGPRYLAVYRTIDMDVFRSDAYLALQRRPDERSRQLIPMFLNTIKGFCNVFADHGVAEGAYMAVILLDLSDCDQQAFRELMDQDILPGVLASKNIVSAYAGQADVEIASMVTSQFMRQGDTFIDGVIIIEGTSQAAVEAVLPLIDKDMLARHNVVVSRKPSMFSHLVSFHPDPRSDRSRI